MWEVETSALMRRVHSIPSTSGNMSYLSTPVVEVADTVGAGDSFSATFASSIIKGLSVGEAHRRAVEVSAYVCTQHGATPVLPERFTKDF